MPGTVATGPAPIMTPIEFTLRGDHITLDRLLKATGLAGSGGQAKAWIAEGRVRVDGASESRKTAKVRAGQVVTLDQEARILVRAPQEAGAEGDQA